MIIESLAPAKIGILGGGTDIASYSDVYGGLCINMAITLRQHVMVYTDDDMWGYPSHRFPSLADPQLFYTILDKYKFNGLHHLRVISSFDGSIKSGIGSSAAASVALIGALRKYTNQSFSRLAIAKQAYEIEVDDLKWYGGRQDQYACAFGGFNLLSFTAERALPVQFEKEIGDSLFPYLVLVYTGNPRESRTIQKDFTKLSRSQIKSLHKIKQLTTNAIAPIIQTDIDRLSQIMQAAWEYKKESNKQVTNLHIDTIYEAALEHGALAGKLLGAGVGGYMLFLCPPEKQTSLMQVLQQYQCERVDFQIDYQGVTTRIL